MDLTFSDVLKRLALWTVVCSISAAPSFLWASAEFDRLAMVTGVVLFIAALTGLTCTRRFERFKRRAFVRRTLYIGYRTRVVLSILFPVAMFLDLYPGLLSIVIVDAMGFTDTSYLGTLLITLIQGTILNTIISVFMLIVYGFQRLILPMPADSGCRACGYDLRGNPDGRVCPECGAAVVRDADDVSLRQAA